MTREWIRLPIAWLAAIGLFVASPSLAETEDTAKIGAAQPSDEIEKQVQEDIDKQATECRRAMFEEARSALAETNAALRALEEDKTKDALDALARATGKLEILLAREPDLALVPVDVRFVTHDLYATVDQIREARDQAEELLEDGKVQEADFKKFRNQIAELERKIAAHDPTTGVFGRLRQTLDELQTSFFD